MIKFFFVKVYEILNELNDKNFNLKNVNICIRNRFIRPVAPTNCLISLNSKLWIYIATVYSTIKTNHVTFNLHVVEIIPQHLFNCKVKRKHSHYLVELVVFPCASRIIIHLEVKSGINDTPERLFIIKLHSSSTYIKARTLVSILTASSLIPSQSWWMNGRQE